MLTYAKVDGPPDDWAGLEIIDLQTGAQVEFVLEASTVYACGWVRKYRASTVGGPLLAPDGREFLQETIYGRFEIRRPRQ